MKDLAKVTLNVGTMIIRQMFVGHLPTGAVKAIKTIILRNMLAAIIAVSQEFIKVCLLYFVIIMLEIIAYMFV